MFKFLLATFLVSGWVTGIVAGFVSLIRYESTPGKSTNATPIAKGPAIGKWRFELVVSNECPCSRASVNAFKAAVDSHPDATTAEVTFVGHPGEADSLLNRAESIRGCTIKTVGTPPNGAKTSGQAFLYDPSGKLVYSGGLTQGRGVDDTRFAMNLFDAALAHKTIPKSGSVFGCALERITR